MPLFKEVLFKQLSSFYREFAYSGDKYPIPNDAIP